MITQPSLIAWHERILVFLLEYRNSHPGFVFWLRTKDSSRSEVKRLESGYWFQGDENYIFVSFHDGSGGVNMTRSMGWVMYFDNEEQPHFKIEIVWTNESDPPKIPFYKEVVAALNADVKAHEQKYARYLPDEDWQISLLHFIENTVPQIDSIINQHTLQDKLILTKEKFRKQLDKTLRIRQQFNVLQNIIKEQTQMRYSLNTILYGPPGTGKTFLLQSLLEKFTTQTQQVNVDEEEKNLWLKDATWWEVLAHVIYHMPSSVTVPQLKQQGLIKAKFAQSEIKHFSQRLWSTLQHHTVAECPLVALERRLSPPIFWKDGHSLWRLNSKEEFLANFPELVLGPKSIAENLPQELNFKRYRFTTAHQSWSYEDFVEGIKPMLNENEENGEMVESSLSYYNKNGLFYDACNEAAKLAGYKNLQDSLRATKKDRAKAFSNAPEFILCIDEINRCNISAVLGELITLIEEDKRLGRENEISDIMLPYSRRPFGVPSNLYILGTMNTADRSVEALDAALRRRFSFVEMMPDYSVLEESGIDKQVNGLSIKKLLQTLNERITWLKDKDHQIGHSYLMHVTNEDELRSAFSNSIIPLLQEYFYNDYASIHLILGNEFVEKIKPPAFAVTGSSANHYSENYRLKTLPMDLVNAFTRMIAPGVDIPQAQSMEEDV